MREQLTRLERASRLDRFGDRLQRGVMSVLRPQRLRDALHGVWLGHPLHPVLVQVPVGAWLSAAVLDLLPGQRRAATTLVAVGTASVIPAAIAGFNDWASLSREQRRVGLVHAGTNLVGSLCYVASLAARLSGRHGLGRVLGFAGLAAANGGAYLGGHLAYKQAAGVNQAVPDLREIDEGWHPVADLATLPEGTLLSREINDVAVVVYRDGDDITVMLEHCAHQRGPLAAGSVRKINGRTCVTCPWHGSTFGINGGEVIHGPAATDQQVLPTRVIGGVLQTRLP
jgi:nitrite reductase/ring-hydroxylating ferredoxin subunit/uncharacterized membrane protein